MGSKLFDQQMLSRLLFHLVRSWPTTPKHCSARPDRAGGSAAFAVDDAACAAVAQLLVYWLDEGEVPLQMREALYKGIREYSLQNNERAETEADEQRFKSRWLRWRIHGTEHLFWILPSCSEDQWILCLHALCTRGTRFCPHTIQAR